MLQRNFLEQESLGEYELTLKLKDLVGKFLAPNEVPAAIKQAGLPAPPPINVPQPPPSIEAAAATAAPASVDEIACPNCTLMNPSISRLCEACGASLTEVPGYKSIV